jgi:hypothetical protein
MFQIKAILANLRNDERMITSSDVDCKWLMGSKNEHFELI